MDREPEAQRWRGTCSGSHSSRHRLWPYSSSVGKVLLIPSVASCLLGLGPLLLQPEIDVVLVPRPVAAARVIGNEGYLSLVTCPRCLCSVDTQSWT